MKFAESKIVKLMSGTAISQIIPIIFIPLLASVYTPIDFGIYAIYTALVTVGAMVVTGRYELALTVSESLEEASGLFTICLTLALSASALIFLVLQTVGKNYYEAFSHINTVLLCLGILSFSINQAAYYWCNRLDLYSTMSIGRVIFSLLLISFQLSFSFFDMNDGLILGQLAAQVASTMFMLNKCKDFYTDKVSFKSSASIARKHSSFPKTLLPAHLINSLSSQIPVFALNYFGGASTVGNYSMSQRIVGSPLQIIGSVFNDVFRGESAKSFRENGNFVRIYISTFKRLTLIGLVVFPTIALLSPILINALFGEEWKLASSYIYILLPMFFLRFICNPLAGTYIILSKSKFDLRWQGVLLFLTAISCLIGLRYNSVMYFLIAYSALYSLMYIINITFSYKYAIKQKST